MYAGLKYYQFTAIDDCTRLRVLRIYDRLNQKTAIAFADFLLDKFPFRSRSSDAPPSTSSLTCCSSWPAGPTPTVVTCCGSRAASADRTGAARPVIEPARG